VLVLPRFRSLTICESTTLDWVLTLGAQQVVQKRRGRPKGVKDSRPRKSRYAETASTPPPADAAPAPTAAPAPCASSAVLPQPADVDSFAGGRMGGELPLMQLLGANGARLWF
jgi:hypothetical protein